MAMARGHRAERRPGTLLAAGLVAALVAAACVSCAPGGPGGPPSATAKFCEVWAEVQETPPTEDEPVLVTDDVAATAEETTTVGSACTGPNAAIQLDGAMLAEGEEVATAAEDAPAALRAASAEGTDPEDPDDEPKVALGAERVSAGARLLDNVSVSVLSAELRPSGIRLTGNVHVRLDGVRSTIGYVGTMRDLQNWSISLSSTGLTIPGISSTPVVFSGRLEVSHGTPSLSLTARATEVRVGETQIKSAEIALHASPTTGVDATVTGDVTIGSSSVAGTVAVAFDHTGALVSAQADLALQLSGRQANGSRIELDGTVQLHSDPDTTVVNFDATGNIGNLQVHAAAGKLRLEGKKATFDGVVDLVDGANTARVNATIIFDGNAAHIVRLDGEAAGEFSGTLPNGDHVSVSGQLSTEVIWGVSRTVVTGRFTIGTLEASGRAVVEKVGVRTTLEVDAQVNMPELSGRLLGSIVIEDGRAERVALEARVNSLALESLTVKDALLRITSSNGGRLEFEVDGTLKVHAGEVTGELDGEITANFDRDGRLTLLEGHVDITESLDLGGFKLYDGELQLTATPQRLTVSIVAGLSFTKWVSLIAGGTLSIYDGDPTWYLEGTGGQLTLVPLIVVLPLERFSVTPLEGLRALRVGLWHQQLLRMRYLEVDIKMAPDGECQLIDIRRGAIVPRLGLKAALGDHCPVDARLIN